MVNVINPAANPANASNVPKSDSQQFVQLMKQNYQLSRNIGEKITGQKVSCNPFTVAQTLINAVLVIALPIIVILSLFHVVSPAFLGITFIVCGVTALIGFVIGTFSMRSAKKETLVVEIIKKLATGALTLAQNVAVIALGIFLAMGYLSSGAGVLIGLGILGATVAVVVAVAIPVGIALGVLKACRTLHA